MHRSFRLRATGGVLLAAVLLLPETVLGLDSATEARLERIERQLESRGLMDMLRQLEQLQRDVQQLRGELEVQAHRTEDMERRQRELYLDIDRRLQQLETGQAPQPAGVSAPSGMAGPGDVLLPPPAAPQREPAAPGGLQPGPAAAAPGAITAAEQAEYDKALAILRDGRYTDAAAAFNSFLTQHPNSGLADNATYWLGETYYVTRDFDQAMAMFSKLVEFQPQSPKVPDARLKIGYIHYEQKDWAAARQELNTLVSNYPGTTAARLASDRLQRMKKEGH